MSSESDDSFERVATLDACVDSTTLPNQSTISLPDLSTGTMDQSADSSLTLVERVSAQNEKINLLNRDNAELRSKLSELEKKLQMANDRVSNLENLILDEATSATEYPVRVALNRLLEISQQTSLIMVHQSGMFHDSMDDLVDGMERMRQTSFLDLPDEIIVMIMKNLDLPNQCKLSINKRLVGLQLRVKNSIDKLTIDLDEYSLEVELSNGRSLSRCHVSIECMVATFRRLALNTHIKNIQVTIEEHHEDITRILDALSNFDADELDINQRYPYNLPPPQVTFSTILALAKNVRCINMECMDGTSPLTAQDLCALRKMMLESGCKLERFFVIIGHAVKESFLEECFGVTVEENIEANTIMYRTTNKSVELYCTVGYVKGLYHLENGFWTDVGGPVFSVDKHSLYMEDMDYYKVKMNHTYSLE